MCRGMLPFPVYDGDPALEQLLDLRRGFRLVVARNAVIHQRRGGCRSGRWHRAVPRPEQLGDDRRISEHRSDPIAHPGSYGVDVLLGGRLGEGHSEHVAVELQRHRAELLGHGIGHGLAGLGTGRHGRQVDGGQLGQVGQRTRPRRRAAPGSCRSTGWPAAVRWPRDSANSGARLDSVSYPPWTRAWASWVDHSTRDAAVRGLMPPLAVLPRGSSRPRWPCAGRSAAAWSYLGPLRAYGFRPPILLR